MDAERLFSPDLADFMSSKGYQHEAKYIRTIWNWRRANDERGLSERERSKFNYQFLNMLLDDLMPWYTQEYDDERGLSERERSKFNYQFLSMLLDDLMPWYTQEYDFSLLEVNRYV